MIAKTILEQIGGRRSAVITGSKDFIDMGNMRFYRKTFSKKTFESRTKDIETHEGIYCDMLEDVFTMVTGLYTRF